jgi:hypothetical protein
LILFLAIEKVNVLIKTYKAFCCMNKQRILLDFYLPKPIKQLAVTEKQIYYTEETKTPSELILI